jgi:hypothetical protein
MGRSLAPADHTDKIRALGARQLLDHALAGPLPLLQEDQEIGHLLPVRPLVELPDDVGADLAGGGQDPKEIPTRRWSERVSEASRILPKHWGASVSAAWPPGEVTDQLLDRLEVESEDWAVTLCGGRAFVDVASVCQRRLVGSPLPHSDLNGGDESCAASIWTTTSNAGSMRRGACSSAVATHRTPTKRDSRGRST